MADEPTQPGRLGRLLARLRQGEPVRPRWRHFALHVLVVVVAAASFFRDLDMNSGSTWGLNGISFLLSFFLPLFFIPVSLLHALWRWLSSWSWRGCIWLLRPALLCLAVSVIPEAYLLGKKWDFERRLPSYAEVIPLLQQSRATPLRPGAKEAVQLPEQFRSLTHGGTATLVGTCWGLAIYFDQRRGPDIYIDGDPPPELRDGYWYDKHWYLVTSSVP